MVNRNPNPVDALAALLTMPQQLADLRDELVALRAAVERSSRYLSVVDAAKDRGVTERTMRRWIADSKVAVVRVGKTVRVDMSSLEPSTAGEVARTARLRSVGGGK